MLLLRGKPGKTSCCFLLKDFGFSSLKRLVGDARGSLVLAEAGAAFSKKKKKNRCRQYHSSPASGWGGCGRRFPPAAGARHCEGFVVIQTSLV